MNGVEHESVRAAMDQAWQDHQHTRDQTWKSLQIEFAIAAAVVGVNWQLSSTLAGIVCGGLVFVTTLCGIQITLRHRNRVEITKFRHIMHCEEFLGLHTPELIDGVQEPAPVSFGDIFRFEKANTAIFILRMHFAIMVFSLVFIAWGVGQ